jgi:hypothetical protein
MPKTSGFPPAGAQSVDAALAYAATLGFDVALASSTDGSKRNWEAWIGEPEAAEHHLAEAEHIDPASALLLAIESAIAARRRAAGRGEANRRCED